MLIRSFLIALVIVSIGTYIALSPPVLTILVPGLILSPSKTDLSEYKGDAISGITPQDVFFKSASGNTLHGWYFQSKNPGARVLLYCHGSGGNIALNAGGYENLLSSGLSLFCFDYSGFGKSTGKASMSDSLLDSDAAYDYLLKERKFAPSQIVLFGGSFGGAVACHLAEHKPAAAIIIQSTFCSLLKHGREAISFFKIYPAFLQPNPALDNGKILAQAHMPLLIVHSSQDQLIPLPEAQETYSLASQPKSMLVLPNSDHYSVKPEDQKEYRTCLKTFLSKLDK